jgi:hypothetical protein
MGCIGLKGHWAEMRAWKLTDEGAEEESSKQDVKGVEKSVKLRDAPRCLARWRTCCRWKTACDSAKSVLPRMPLVILRTPGLATNKPASFITGDAASAVLDPAMHRDLRVRFLRQGGRARSAVHLRRSPAWPGGTRGERGS